MRKNKTQPVLIELPPTRWQSERTLMERQIIRNAIMACVNPEGFIENPDGKLIWTRRDGRLHNKSKVARYLGISLPTLDKRLVKFGIDWPKKGKK